MDVVRTYKSLATAMRDRLSEETWSVLMKTMMGVADRILRDPRENLVPVTPPAHRDAGGDPAESVLVPFLVESMFEVWILSETQNEALTDRLSALAYGWTHREVVLRAWYWACRGLTRRLLSILYDAPYPYSPKVCGRASPRRDQEARFAKADMQKYVIIQSVTEKEPERQTRFYNISEEQVAGCWLNMWTLLEHGRGRAKGGMSMLSSPETYRLYLQMLAILNKDFYLVSSLVKRKHKEIVYDPAEIAKLSSAKPLSPPFPQSATLRDELSLVYVLFSPPQQIESRSADREPCRILPRPRSTSWSDPSASPCSARPQRPLYVLLPV